MKKKPPELTDVKSQRWIRGSNRNPVDRVAAKVTSTASDQALEMPTSNLPRSFSETPPAIYPPEPGTPNLRGTRFGRMVVMGVSAYKRGNENRLWVCRCDCGCFEDRRIRSIKADTERAGMCTRCDYEKQINERLHLKEGG